MEAPAKMMAMCIHAKKVRSLAKNTFGSTLIGAFLGFSIGLARLGVALLFLKNLEKKPGPVLLLVEGVTSLGVDGCYENCRKAQSYKDVRIPICT